MQRLLSAVLLTYFIFFTAMCHAIVRRHDVDVNEQQGLYRNLGNSFDSAVWINCPAGFCSGTLIAPDWVLTAAHCVDTLTQGQFGQVRIGNGSAFALGEFTTGGRTVVDVKLHPNWDSTFQHPDFKTGRLGSFHFGDDLALIQLSSPVIFTAMNRHSGTVASLLEEDVTFVGYGDTGTGLTGDTQESNTKRGGQNTIDRRGSALDPNGCPPDCRHDYSHDLILTDFDSTIRVSNIPLHNRWGSATPKPLEASTGGGDSGGPWVVGGRLAGVTSFGEEAKYGDYSAAGAVQPHRAWINSTMGGVNWNARGTSTFRTAANWGDGVVPLATEAVRFNLPNIPFQSAPVVSIGTGGQEVGRMTVEFGTHVLDINGEAFGFKVNGRAVIQKNGVLVVREGRLTTTGTLDISTGGRLDLPAGAERALSISTTNTSDGLFIGRNESGTLDQNARIDVIGRTFAGYAVGSQGIYNQNAAIFTDGDVFFGREGSGVWNNAQTARASITGDLVFGNNAQGYGAYKKNGGGLTTVTNGTMVVGWDGEGDVTMSAGAINPQVDLIIGRNVSSGRRPGSDGNSFVNNGGTLTVGRNMLVGLEGLGTFEQSAGTTTVGGNLTIGASSTIRLAGGELNVTGNYSQHSNANFNITLGFNGPEFDDIDIMGTATLGGALNLSLIEGFLPNSSDVFTVLDSASILGSFANVLSGDWLPFDGGSFKVSYGVGSSFDPTQIVLSDFLSASLSGDFDLDGDVDGRDFLAWQRNPSVGDLADWQSNYGTQVLSAATAVPEPTALVLICGVLISCCLCRFQAN